MTLFLCSCGSKTIKYSHSDTWVIQLSDEFSLECHFDEINRIIIQFNREIDVFRKIDIKTDNTFWGSEDKDFLGIRIFLYTD